MRERRARLLIAAAIGVLLAPPAGAQAGLGPLDDATVAPRGMFRLRAITAWARYDTRFADTGETPLGAPFTSEALGRSQIPALGNIDSLISAAIEQPFALSLGRSRLDARGRHEIIPIGLEYGLTNRFTIGVVVPVVRKRVAVQFRLDSTGATVGPNLHRSAPAAQLNNVLVQTQFASAASQLQSRLQSCQGDPSGAGCASLLARQAEAEALIAASEAFASTVHTLYGGSSSSGMAFVPTAQSPAHAAIELRVLDFNTRYRELLEASSDLLTTVPTPAAVPAGSAELQQYLSAELGGDSLNTEERSGIGNVEVALRALLVDRPMTPTRRMGLRMTGGVAYRLPTGSQQSPSPLADLRLDEPSGTLDLSLAMDVQAGRLGVLSQAELGIVPIGEEPIAEPNLPVAFARLAQDDRRTALHLAPRVHLSPPLSIHGAYSMRSGNVTGTEQFVGGGVAFSTLGLYREGGVLPLEMRYTHLESLSGPAGQPKYFRDQIEFRVYFRFGR